jgi:hypothetical protein
MKVTSARGLSAALTLSLASLPSLNTQAAACAAAKVK